MEEKRNRRWSAETQAFALLKRSSICLGSFLLLINVVSIVVPKTNNQKNNHITTYNVGEKIVGTLSIIHAKSQLIGHV